MKKTAIIGGNGFIGSNLANFLIKKNKELKILDKYIDENKFNSNSLAIDFVKCDINNTSKLISYIKDCTEIIWLVHTSVPSTSMTNIINDLNSNLNPLVNFLIELKKIDKIKKFIFLSSGGTIYGEPEIKEPIRENHIINPISNYGLTKFIQEKYISLILKFTQIKVFILRPSNVYGVNQNLDKPQGIIGHTFKSIENKIPIDLYGSGKVIRDFIYVDDLSQAIYNCLEFKSCNNNLECYNIGSQNGLAIIEIIKRIEKITKQKVKINYKKTRHFDCSYNVLDSSSFSKYYSWEAIVDIEKGLSLISKSL